jgi:hypothetical protein
MSRSVVQSPSGFCFENAVRTRKRFPGLGVIALLAERMAAMM